MRAKAINSYNDIQKCLLKYGASSVPVNKIIEEYRAYKRGYYIPNVPKLVIFDCENQIRTVLRYKNKLKGLPGDY